MKINIKKKIKSLENEIKNPKKGLPEDIFLFTTRICPQINVDLLIKNKKKETLLTWREKDKIIKADWHIPGGIIRVRETIKHRISEVAKHELKSRIIFKKKPIAIKEIHLDQYNRSHFISLLYKCTLTTRLPKFLKSNNDKILTGQYHWFKKMPKNIISIHKIYQKYINDKK